MLTDWEKGYDNTTTYLDPPSRYFGPIVGRYANRIKNGTVRPMMYSHIKVL